MRLETYLLTEGRSKTISKEAAIDLLQDNCKQAISAFEKGYRMYRGVDNKNDFLYIDPKKGIRRSTSNIPNYYTYILSNHKDWKAYPKRSRSLICATDDLSATGYGSGIVYVVFPYDGAKIGVCSGTDIWHSFVNLTSSATGATTAIQNIFAKLGLGKSDNSFKVFKGACKKVDTYLKENPDNMESLLFSINSDTSFTYTGDFYNNIAKLFSPKGFKLKKIGNSLPSSNEVWTDSECIMVKETAMDDLYGVIL